MKPVRKSPNKTQLEKGLVLTRRALRDTGVRLLDEGQQSDEVVTCGLLGDVKLDCGIHAKFGRRMQVSDLEMEVSLDAQVSIKLFLEGYVEASLDGTPLPMPKKTTNGKWQSSAIIVSHGDGAKLRRTARKGQYLDKMVIGLPLDWLKRWSDIANASPGYRALLKGETGFWNWTPSPKAEFIARQMYDIAARRPPFSSLLQETNVLALVSEALTSTFGTGAGGTGAPGKLTSAEQQRLYALVQYIDKHTAQTLSLQSTAADLATSQATLQRLVRKAYNCSLNEYLRNKWLDNARQSLLYSNNSISDIAFSSGYVHISNFTTAFRRRFGYPPSHLRRSSI